MMFDTFFFSFSFVAPPYEHFETLNRLVNEMEGKFTFLIHIEHVLAVDLVGLESIRSSAAISQK